jgi:shikimate dehydrogenase
MKEYGLIGKKLSHSYSKEYFDGKFIYMDLPDHSYHLFELDSISELPSLLESHPELKGLNVTIPYKEDIFQYLSSLDQSAEKVGAVNVVKILPNRSLKGYNSDYFGFKSSLTSWIKPFKTLNTLVLGTGGSSKAVQAVLNDLELPFTIVSRTKLANAFTYEDLKQDPSIVGSHLLIVNCTPLGMYPDIHTFPQINYNELTEIHALFDLVYNPEMTQFLKKGFAKGCHIKNGFEMLNLQAEKSWEIWTS